MTGYSLITGLTAAAAPLLSLLSLLSLLLGWCFLQASTGDQQNPEPGGALPHRLWSAVPVGGQQSDTCC